MTSPRRPSARRHALAALAAVLLGAGGWLLYGGVRTWQDTRAAQRTVRSFATAIAVGDREAAVSHLAPEVRERIALAPPGRLPWAEMDGVKISIRRTEVDADRATISGRITRNGFAVQPTFFLRRHASDEWRIARVDDLEVDPRWHAWLEEAARQDGERLARELAERLKGRSGATVQRFDHERELR